MSLEIVLKCLDSLVGCFDWKINPFLGAHASAVIDVGAAAAQGENDEDEVEDYRSSNSITRCKSLPHLQSVLIVLDMFAWF